MFVAVYSYIFGKSSPPFVSFSFFIICFVLTLMILIALTQHSKAVPTCLTNSLWSYWCIYVCWAGAELSNIYNSLHLFIYKRNILSQSITFFSCIGLVSTDTKPPISVSVSETELKKVDSYTKTQLKTPDIKTKKKKRKEKTTNNSWLVQKQAWLGVFTAVCLLRPILAINESTYKHCQGNKQRGQPFV